MTNHHYCQLQIGLLGPFYLVVDQEEIKEDVWKSKKALTMLKYLAAKAGQKVSSDVLIELLWPDNEAVDSTSNLHTAVWFVRRILTSKQKAHAESRLRYANGSYWLEIRDGCVDLELFEKHVQKSRTLTKSDPRMALFHCESALELYRDDFLSEEMYEEWTISYREDYQELYFEAILRSAELLMEHRSDLQGAIEILRSAVKKDQFREELYQMGIKAYILGGRQVDAINLYKKYSKMLMDEFQLQPSQATQDLILQLQDKGIQQESTFSLDLKVEPTNGAYVCDRETLLFILKTEQRRLTRGGNNFSILVVASKEGNSRRQQMQTAFHILQRSLRSSDLISQCSDDLIIAFIPDTKAAQSQALFRRLRQKLQEKLVEITTFSCTLLDSEYLEDMQKNLESILA